MGRVNFEFILKSTSSCKSHESLKRPCKIISCANRCINQSKYTFKWKNNTSRRKTQCVVPWRLIDISTPQRCSWTIFWRPLRLELSVSRGATVRQWWKPFAHPTKSRRQRQILNLIEFVVSSLLCTERIFSGYSNFQPPPQKNNTSKFQFVLDARTRLNEFLNCPKDGFLLSCSFYMHSYVIFTRVKIEAMDGRPRENVKVERVLRLRATFRTSPLIYGRKIYVRAHIKITQQWKFPLTVS